MNVKEKPLGTRIMDVIEIFGLAASLPLFFVCFPLVIMF